MTDSPINLGSILKYIADKKKIKSNLHIDQSCTINGKDPKPLVKVINYLLNYLKQISEDVIDISLKEQSNGCLLCLIISTDQNELPPLNKVLHS